MGIFKKKKQTAVEQPPIVPGYFVKTPEEVQDELKTSIEHGLDTQEISERLAQYGPNLIQASEGIKIHILIARHTFNFMQGVLLVAAIVFMALKEWIDAGVIFAIIVINTIVGFSQEYRSEKTLAALRELSAPTSTVIRDGHQTEISSDHIVPGDVVVLKEGDRIPCDVRLFKIASLECDEAILTGESLPVEKTIKALKSEQIPLGDRTNSAFMSTVVTKGKGKGIAVATGTRTELGKIADSIAKTEKGETKLQQRMDKLGQVLVLAAFIAVVIVMLAGWGWDTFDDVWGDGLIVGVSTAVALIPESLLPVLTLTLTLGVRRLAKRNAIIRKLSALESFGNITDICSDKTGTLTQGKMVTTEGWFGGHRYEVTGEGFVPEGHLVDADGNKVEELEDTIVKSVLVAGLCNNASLNVKTADNGTTEYIPVGSPTEVSLIVLAKKLGMKPTDLKQTWTFVAEYPFSSTIKRMSMVYCDQDEQNFLFAKGAPEGITSLCTKIHLKGESPREITPEDHKKINEENHRMASEGLRVLALSYRYLTEHYEPGEKRGDIEQELVFVGLVGIKDPPRPGVPESIAKCHRAGIVVRMVTGDHPTTSFAIAKSIGIINPHMSSDEAGERLTTAMDFDQLTDEDLGRMAHLPLVIARCSPASKVKMVGALHQRDRFVAMTGDGVNDAPAISAADVGAAMGKTGSDVTKEASDVVLTDDDFSTIVVAIEEGRRIINNIRKFMIHLLTSNVAEGILLVIAIVAGLQPPLSPLQILWVNFVTATPPAMALGVQPSTKELMDQNKRPVGEGLFTTETLIDFTYYGTIMGVISLAIFLIGQNVLNYDLKTAQGATFASLTILLLLHGYNCVDQRKSCVSKRALKSYWLHLAVLVGIGSIILAFFVPAIRDDGIKHGLPDGAGWGYVIGGSILFMILSDLYKLAKKYVVKLIKRRRTVYLADLEMEF